jgi:hypothetical protein
LAELELVALSVSHAPLIRTLPSIDYLLTGGTNFDAAVWGWSEVSVSLLSVIVDGCRRGAIAFCAAAVVAIGAAACAGGRSTAAPTSSTAAPTSSAAAAGSPTTAGGGPHFPAQLFGLNKNTGRAGKQVAREVSSELSYARSILHSPKAALYGTESPPAS